MAAYEYADVHGSVVVHAPIARGPGEPPACAYCGQPLRRVWDFGLSNITELRRERERGGSSAVRDLFLPTAKELAGPGDPDGAKAIREWNETHDPKPGNSKPLRPEAPRTVF
jgi:hypothetical protein